MPLLARSLAVYVLAIRLNKRRSCVLQSRSEVDVEARQREAGHASLMRVFLQGSLQHGVARGSLRSARVGRGWLNATAMQSLRGWLARGKAGLESARHQPS